MHNSKRTSLNVFLIWVICSIIAKTDGTKEVRTVELSTHSLSISWKSFDETAKAFVATISPLDSGETTQEPYKRVEAIKKCLLVYINESFATWTDLVPGKTYQISVVSVTQEEEVSSESQQTTDITTRPMPPSDLTAVPFSTNDDTYLDPTYGLLVNWEEPLFGFYDHFMVSFYPPYGKIKKRAKRYLDDSTERVIVDLMPGLEYTVMVTTESNGVQSETSFVQAIIPPQTPPTLQIEKYLQESMELYLTWNSPHIGYIDDYDVMVEGGDVIVEQAKKKDQKFRAIRNIVPGTSYEFAVWSVSNYTRSNNASLLQWTAPPLPPSSVRAVLKSANFIDLKWDKPMGEVDFYQVEYSKPEDNGPSIVLKVNEEQFRLSDLEEGAEYLLSVTSYSNGVRSMNPTVTSVFTKPAPKPSDDGVAPDAITLGENKTATIMCESNGITLYLKKVMYEKFEKKFGPLYFGDGDDRNCYGTEFKTYFRYHIGPALTSCNTGYTVNDTHVNYTNMLTNGLAREEYMKRVTDPSNTVIFGRRQFEQFGGNEQMPDFKMNVMCIYKTDYNVQVDYLPAFINYTVATFEKKGYGEFFARMRLFKSGMYTEPYKYVPSLLAYDTIYVQVDLLKADNDTKIVVKRCWATPQEDPNFAVSYPIIEDRCPIPGSMDGGLVVTDNGAGHHVRWEGPVFKFVDDEKVWLHCSLQVCFHKDCEPYCPDDQVDARNRRSAQDPDSHVISAGPIKKDDVIRMTVDDATTKEAPKQEIKSNSNDDIIIAAIVVLLFVIIFSTVVIVKLGWRMRRTKSDIMASYSNDTSLKVTKNHIPVPSITPPTVETLSVSSRVEEKAAPPSGENGVQEDRL